MGDVFISYKQDERERMRPIADGLRALGVDVWFDERLQPDRSFTEEIHQVMSTCKAQIVCWSPLSVASEWVRGEAEVARQRGVLVAVMIESCTLLPPFNMHHAESLVGWGGDPKHAGWRKVCDAVGRRVDRPGLGELAALQGSADAIAWKKWAQKFPNDPAADAAWATAEELEVSGARERMARDREAAKRAADEAQRKGANQGSALTQSASPSAQPPPRASSTGQRGRLLLMGAGTLVALIAAAVLIKPYPSWFGSEAEQRVQSANDLEGTAGSVETEASSEGPGMSAASNVPQENAGEAIDDAVRHRRTESATIAQVPPSDPAGPLRVALDGITPQQWSASHPSSLQYMVLGMSSSLEPLQSAASADPRAQTILAITAYYRGNNPVESARLYRLAADQGFARAQADLGNRYRQGNGVRQDYVEAIRLLRLASAQGNAFGQYGLGRMYAQGLGGVRLDRSEAVRLYRLAAQQGNQEGQAALTELGESW